MKQSKSSGSYSSGSSWYSYYEKFKHYFLFPFINGAAMALGQIAVSLLWKKFRELKHTSNYSERVEIFTPQPQITPQKTIH